MNSESVNFYNLTLSDLRKALASLGKEGFRAQQIYKWVYQQRIHDYEQMTNLSKAFRAQLPSFLHFNLPKVVHEARSVDGTRKFLFDMEDAQTVEAVLIPSDERLTLVYLQRWVAI